MINELWKNLGFGDKEIDIYLTILKNGKIIPSDVARITGINRSTVYSIASELVKKGLISNDLSGAIKYFVASPPDDLFGLIKKDEDELARKKTLVKKTVEEMKGIRKNARYSIPKIRFVLEEELDNFFYKQNDVWEKSALEVDPFWYGFQDNTFVENYSQYINWYWNRPDRKLGLKMFSNKYEMENVLGKKQYPDRQIKFFQKKMPFTASVKVIGAYIVMVVTNQKPHYAIEIKNEELAKNFRVIFKILWELME